MKGGREEENQLGTSRLEKQCANRSFYDLHPPKPAIQAWCIPTLNSAVEYGPGRFLPLLDGTGTQVETPSKPHRTSGGDLSGTLLTRAAKGLRIPHCMNLKIFHPNLETPDGQIVMAKGILPQQVVQPGKVTHPPAAGPWQPGLGEELSPPPQATPVRTSGSLWDSRCNK